MAQLESFVAASNPCDRTIVYADQLTEGDIIRHFTGDVWQVINEPEYTNQGITFEVLWLDVDSADNTQTVYFDPQWKFELVSYETPAVELVA